MSSSKETGTYRPALVKLSKDVRGLSEELLDGLESEDRVLTWIQEVTIRTLGLLDTIVYNDLVRQFRGPQGVMVASLVRPSERRGDMRELDEAVAQRYRENLIANKVSPAHRDAYRALRNDAGEYADEAGEGDEHDPQQQTFVAMRPSLSILEERQQSALSALLEGFDERADILGWGDDVVHATDGELGKDWVTRAYDESSTAVILTGGEQYKPARRLFAAYHLLPRFRAGVRERSGKAKELPSEDSTRTEVPYA